MAEGAPPAPGAGHARAGVAVSAVDAACGRRHMRNAADAACGRRRKKKAEDAAGGVISRTLRAVRKKEDENPPETVITYKEVIKLQPEKSCMRQNLEKLEGVQVIRK